jgi:2-polyprenyl-6-methoxyphenol hydroxylase-like FAD-dependent oxidoreductase
MSKAGTDVIVVGAGPVGLWLAAELRLAGVPTTVLERTAKRGPFTRGIAVHARTIEVLAMRGAAGVPLEQGRKRPQWHYGLLTTLVDFSGLDTAFPFVLAYPQSMLEDLLERRAVELGATVRRGFAVTGLTQDGGTVRVAAEGPDGPEVFEARYVAGCDGAGSTVRKAAGIGFPGTDASLYGYLGDVTLEDPPERGTVAVAGAGGALMVAPLPGGRFRVVGFDPADQDPDVPLTEDRLRASVAAAGGRDFGLHEATWLSRFGNATRQADRYRSGRVLLAGDAAHMHLPTGGVGLNVGVQDAMNLGWKLAAVVQGRAADGLLDSYHAERHPVGARLLADTRAQTALITTFSAEGLALRDALAGLLGRVPAMGAQLAAEMSGLALRYPSGDPGAHELTGRRIPDLPVGDTSLFGLLAGARPVLLEFTGGTVAAAVAGLAADLCISTHVAGPWPGPEKAAAALVRPDGYCWWATEHPSADHVLAALKTLGIRF